MVGFLRTPLAAPSSYPSGLLQKFNKITSQETNLTLIKSLVIQDNDYGYHLLERILTVPLRDWPSLTAASSSASFLALL